MTIWDYPVGIGTSTRNLLGYDVEATDGGIGKIEEVSNVVGQAHLVVDTGLWTFGKKRMIPAGVVREVDDENEKVRVGLSKDQIKAAPDFDAQRRNDRDPYDTYYQSYKSSEAS